MPHFEARDTHVRDSGAWKRAEDKVTLWYKIGAVLMDSRLQAVYDREVVATVRAGSSVTDALMKKNMCGELWRRDGREDEMKIKDER